MDRIVMLAVVVVVIGSVLWSWWHMFRRVRARSAKLSGPIGSAMPKARLIARESIAEGALSVDVHLHSLDSPEAPVPCWTYVSKGLWLLGQKEVVFTVKRRPNDAENAYPRDLLAFYKIVHQMASHRQFLDVGGVTLLGPEVGGLLGRKDFVCILYTPPQVLDGVRTKVPSLSGLILTGNEFALHQQYGMVRLMTMLGQRYRFFPTAPWADRDRSELCSPDDLQASILAKPLLRAHLTTASVRKEGSVVSRTERPGPGDLRDQSLVMGSGRIVLRLRPGATDSLRGILANAEDNTAPTLLVGPDPGMVACLSWRPGQTSPAAISLPGVSGRHVAGNFITFVPQQQEEGGIVVEDGFVVFLRTESWRRVRTALTTGMPVSISPSVDKMGLEIVWVPEVDPDFADPVDSHQRGGWRFFEESLVGTDLGQDGTSIARRGYAATQPVSLRGVHLKGLTLLTRESVFNGRVEAEPLADYIRAVLAAIESWTGRASLTTGHDLALECELGPDGARGFRLWVRPARAADALEDLQNHLRPIEPPPVAFGPILFQLNVLLGGGRPVGT